MGRIKSLMVKRTAKELMLQQGELFKVEFNHNKKVLGRTMPSKKIRNKIAGYIARLERAKTKVRKPKPAIVEPSYEQSY